MKIAAIIAHLESIAHPSLQEDYDNAGLITGAADWECSGAIISLDATEDVVMEAIAKNCNLVIAHHPIVFHGLKKINGKNYVEKTIIAAIKNDIAIYAIHTNLDNAAQGVNGMIARQLGLNNCRVLAPKAGLLKKLQVFVPLLQAEAVRNAIFEAGAGHIGNYSECSFNTAGTGTFKAGAGSQPFTGEVGKQQQEDEIRIETIFPGWLENKIITALKKAHPYEEVAYDIVSIDNAFQNVGNGMVGNLKAPVDELTFLKSVKKSLKTDSIRYTKLLDKKVKRVAVCGGAGRFLLYNAIAANADVFITGDFKYHDFFDADNKIVVADVGHYESEQFTKQLLLRHLSEKFPILAARISSVNTNPIKYL